MTFIGNVGLDNVAHHLGGLLSNAIIYCPFRGEFRKRVSFNIFVLKLKAILVAISLIFC